MTDTLNTPADPQQEIEALKEALREKSEEIKRLRNQDDITPIKDYLKGMDQRLSSCEGAIIAFFITIVLLLVAVAHLLLR